MGAWTHGAEEAEKHLRQNPLVQMPGFKLLDLTCLHISRFWHTCTRRARGAAVVEMCAFVIDRDVTDTDRLLVTDCKFISAVTVLKQRFVRTESFKPQMDTEETAVLGTSSLALLPS